RDAKLGGGRRAYLSQVHRQSAEDASLRRTNRRRPARAIALLGGERAIVVPEPVALDVGADHRFASINRGARGGRVGTDDDFVHRFDELRAHRWRTDEAECDVVIVDEMDAAFDTWTLRLMEARDRSQHFAQVDS